MKTATKITFLTFVLTLLSVNNFASKPEFQFRAGLVLQFGNPVNRIGFLAGLHGSYLDFSGNIEFQIHHNFSSFGPKIPSNEIQVRTNLNYSFGGTKLIKNYPNIETPLNPNRHYSLGYGLNFYLDNIKTSQTTGNFIARLHQFYISLENDAFSIIKQKDRYRTAVFKIGYRDSIQTLEWRNVLWTVNTHCKERNHVSDDKNYPARFGYIDYSKCKYASSSNGISALIYERFLPYNQTMQIAIGIDAEQVRHFWQNKLIHDMYFIPKKWIKAKNLHIPMLSENGDLYLFKEGQKIKKPQLFFQLGINSFSSY